MAHLSYNNVALGGFSSFNALVQNVLRHLSGLSTACGSTDDHYWTAIDGVHYLLLKLFDRQLLSLTQPLPWKHELAVSTQEKVYLHV